MTNQESEHRRVVVETPTARREEVHSEAVQYPERRGGVSSAALAAIVIGVVALAAIIVLFVLNQQQTAVNDNMTAQQQPPQTIVQQPAQQQPPIIVQQPAPATQPAPVIINGQSAPAGSTTSSGPDDSTIQTAVDKKFSDDPKLSALGVTATVMNGKVTLMGSVQNAADKTLVERVVRNVKGVKSVDNQITVSGE
jgi:hypothetical protein